MKKDVVFDLSNFNDMVTALSEEASEVNLIPFEKAGIRTFKIKGQLDQILFTSLEWTELHEDRYRINILDLILLAMDGSDEADADNSTFKKLLISQVVSYNKEKKKFTLDLLRLSELMEEVDSPESFEDDDDFFDEEEDMPSKPQSKNKEELN